MSSRISAKQANARVHNATEQLKFMFYAIWEVLERDESAWATRLEYFAKG